MTITQSQVLEPRSSLTSALSLLTRPSGLPSQLETGRCDHPASHYAPPALSPLALLEVAKQFAAKVPAREMPDEVVLTERTYELVALDEEFEVWVIHWPTGGHLELHDHGGSAGAFWVLRGALEERYVDRGREFDVLGERRHVASTGIGFGSHYVHDVRNGGGEVATSVHAYSPPLHSMTYYRTDQHELAADRTEFRSDATWEL